MTRAAGFFHKPGFLAAGEVAMFIAAARDICKAAPLRTPSMPNGTPLSVQVTSAGACGWWADAPKGYRYVDVHPTTKQPFPPIPPWMLPICERALTSCGLAPMKVDSLLINFYREDAKLGLHVDNTEQDRDAPIVSFSVGADAVFAMGGENRSDKTEDVVVSTGDLIVQSGASRGYFHGIKKLLPTLVNPLRTGRLNFTFRKVRV